MVANYHIGLLDVQTLRAPHLHLDAVEVFEGQDCSTQEPRAEEHMWGADPHRGELLDLFQPFTITQGASCRISQARSGLHEQIACSKVELCSVSAMLCFSKHICSLQSSE